MGRMAKNRKVEESAAKVWLNMVSKGASLRSAAGCNSRSVEKCGGKPVCGEGIVRNHHESNRKWKSLSNSFRCRYVGKRPCRYPQDTAESFVKWSSAGLLHSPANKSWLENCDRGGGGEPFAQGWTHTHTHWTPALQSARPPPSRKVSCPTVRAANKVFLWKTGIASRRARNKKGGKSHYSLLELGFQICLCPNTVLLLYVAFKFNQCFLI